MSKLDEIDERYDRDKARPMDIAGGDLRWLIARARKLEAALEGVRGVHCARCASESSARPCDCGSAAATAALETER